MFCPAIDQQREKLTENIRDENGDMLPEMQASTKWKRVRECPQGEETAPIELRTAGCRSKVLAGAEC